MIYKAKTWMIFLILLFSMSSTVLASSDFAVNAKGSVLMEPYSKTVLVENNAHEKLAPASVTKVMTMLLIYESLDQNKIGWDDVVTVSEHAAGMGGSQIFLEPGEEQTVRTLTKCIVVASANDAAVAMAEYISGSEEAFVALMNEKAKELGMENTHFENACGLDTDNHLTTAYDIALMSSELITRYPEVFEFTKIWQDTITHVTRRGNEDFGLTNTNRLIRMYSGATGLKTGSTGKALYCLSGTAERDGMQLVAVVLGAPDAKTRFEETAKLLDHGYANYAIEKGEERGTPVGTVKVYKGKEEQVEAIVKEQVAALIDKGSSQTLEKKVELDPDVKAPILQGDKLGEIVYYLDGEEAGKSDLIASAAVEKASFGDMVKRLMSSWIQ